MRASAVAVLFGLIASLTVASTAGSDLEFRIESDKSTYIPLEPVVMKYSVINSSGGKLKVPALIDAKYGVVKFEIANQGGNFRPYQTGLQPLTVWSLTTLQPGESLSGQVIIVTNGAADDEEGRHPLAEPGKYRVRARYSL